MATSQPASARRKLIVKLLKPAGAPSSLGEYIQTTTATSEDEETRIRALYRISLVQTTHTVNMAEFAREGSTSRPVEELATPAKDPTPESSVTPRHAEDICTPS